MLRLRHRLAGGGTSGPRPFGFRVNGPFWLEEDGETKRLDITRALVIEPEVFCTADPIIKFSTIL